MKSAAEAQLRRAGDCIRSLNVKSIKGSHFLVIGGGGCFGMHLTRALHMLGGHVTIFDRAGFLEDFDHAINFITGDVRDVSCVQKACEGIDCVFHIASYGMSGANMRKDKLIEEINVGGTQKILKACLKNNVQRLVYTSTHNVIFNGQCIENGDESLPYIALDQHKDQYSRTKCMAEQLVIASNGKRTKDGSILRTCAVRAVAIYGRGEQRQAPSIVQVLEYGFFLAKFGSDDVLTSRVHIDNLTNGHLLAADALAEHKNHIAAGEAYLITDKEPKNQFIWMSQLVEGLGYSMPKISIPIWFILMLAFITEHIEKLLHPLMEVTLFLTRTELYQVCKTHYYKLDKAKNHLGYIPLDRDLSDTLEYYIEKGHQRPRSKPSGLMALLLKIAIGLLLAMVLISFLPMVS